MLEARYPVVLKDALENEGGVLSVDGTVGGMDSGSGVSPAGNVGASRQMRSAAAYFSTSRRRDDLMEYFKSQTPGKISSSKITVIFLLTNSFFGLAEGLSFAAHSEEIVECVTFFCGERTRFHAKTFLGLFAVVAEQFRNKVLASDYSASREPGNAQTQAFGTGQLPAGLHHLFDVF
jgi:hypothetical protein